MARARLLAAAMCVLPLLVEQSATAGASKGFYLEARTCQVYTGPCFANGETGLAGKDAVLAWSIREGDASGVSLAGLNVVVVLNASDTLGFEGLDSAKLIRAAILVDERADPAQRQALVEFARGRIGKAADHVVSITPAPITMRLDIAELRGELQAGGHASVTMRKARATDCICSNEVAYYPPLSKVRFFAPGVIIDGAVRGRGLGARWEIPDSRSAYMGLFHE